MAALNRFAFRFPTHTEVRYLESIPVRGQRITKTGDGTWVVARVEQDNEGGYSVTCLQPRDIVRESRSTGRAMRAFARELRERAHDSASRARQQRERTQALTRKLDPAE